MNIWKFGETRVRLMMELLALILYGMSAGIMSNGCNFQNIFGGDPFGTMVVAQSIGLNHTVTLDGKYEKFFTRADGSLRYQVYKSGNKAEYYFPIGTPLILAPFVVLATHFGYNALSANKDMLGQKYACVITIFLILLVTRAIVRNYVREWYLVYLLPLLIFSGTILAPTLATGYWSIDLEILFIGLSYLLCYMPDGNTTVTRSSGVLLGIVLFLGFLVRPTFAIIVFSVFFLLVLEKKYRMLIGAAVMSAAMLVVFSLWSMSHYHAYLPPYYMMSRLSDRHAVEAFAALLASPSRSIFVFSPVLALVLYGGVKYSMRGGFFHVSNSRLMACAIASGLLFLSNVFFPHWTGGWSYGPRILTDLSYVGCIMGLDIIARSEDEDERNVGLKRFVVALMLGVPIAMSGLFNQYAIPWNGYPSIDGNNRIVWDWRFPQPLATRATLANKCITQTRELHLSESQCKAVMK